MTNRPRQASARAFVLELAAHGCDVRGGCIREPNALGLYELDKILRQLQKAKEEILWAYTDPGQDAQAVREEAAM